MKIDTNRIPSSGLVLKFEKQADQFPSLKDLIDCQECDFYTPLSIELNVMQMPDLIIVKGTIGAMVKLTCVRCLYNFNHSLNSNFTFNYSKEIPNDLAPKGEIELTAQQIGMIFYKGDEIDVADALQEQIVLTLPYKPLCRQDCNGLCSQCGENLNLEQCKCNEKINDGPFRALKKLNLSSQDREVR